MSDRTDEPSPYVLQMHAARLEISTQDSRVTALMSGELDAAAASMAHEALARCLEPGVSLDIDMSGVSFIDSKGISLLLGLRKHAQPGGHQVRLVSPSRAVRQALDLVGLSDSFEVHDP